MHQSDHSITDLSNHNSIIAGVKRGPLPRYHQILYFTRPKTLLLPAVHVEMTIDRHRSMARIIRKVGEVIPLKILRLQMRRHTKGPSRRPRDTTHNLLLSSSLLLLRASTTPVFTEHQHIHSLCNSNLQHSLSSWPTAHKHKEDLEQSSLPSHRLRLTSTQSSPMSAVP